ncbi:MAG: AarF/ABC1/UbiB kinase family protein, partial [Chloroflexi bacterium]|nr:AarF/ABC1/UbiB kinase family protein [Chloroflexota bacterium]MBM4435605.1 AarF/ABC1/UbiB kinase family protein [Chloroflexota bacterium]
MGLSLQPRHLARYKDLLALVLRYGRSDLLKRARLEDVLGDELPEPGDEAAASAEDFAQHLERLGPTFVKLGQLLSTRADLLPDPYLAALARLQDHVTPVAFGEVEIVVRDELGVRLSKAFLEFDATPLAAASLAQVHRAVLRDGRAVAVKVQRPGVRRQVADDLEVLEAVADLLERYSESAKRYDICRLVDEFRKSLLRELDYRVEAENLTVLGRALERFPRLVVPAPIADYTTSRVLTMDYVAGTKITDLSPVVLLELGATRLADALFAAYLHQVLVDGFFHADPHPGNLLVTPDGTLALIDLGMVARLTPRMQDQLLQLLLAISEGRGDEAADYAVRLGEPREDFAREDFTRAVRAVVADHQDAALRDLQVGRLVLDVTRVAAENGLRLPPELMMLGKTFLNLDEIGRRLDPEFNPQEALRDHLATVMQRRVAGVLSPATVFGALIETKDLAERLPGRLNRILDRMADDDVPVQLKGFDQTRLMMGLQKIANRITVGLLLAALIIGAAMLMEVETSFRLLGYPGI